MKSYMCQVIMWATRHHGRGASCSPGLSRNSVSRICRPVTWGHWEGGTKEDSAAETRQSREERVPIVPTLPQELAASLILPDYLLETLLKDNLISGCVCVCVHACERRHDFGFWECAPSSPLPPEAQPGHPPSPQRQQQGHRVGVKHSL